MNYKILIVDDEPDIIAMLKDYFLFHGYTVYTAANGTEALAAVSSEPDIILLDINMPDIDGLKVCAAIRKHITCPIIFLTARIEEKDAVLGFQTGADDYVTKPFRVNELGARVSAHLRRGEREATKREKIKMIGMLSIDYLDRQIEFAGKPLDFTKTEFEIINLLSRNAGQVFDRERIYEEVRGYEGTASNTVLNEHIRRIRQKLKEATREEYIQTVWGVGYKWMK